MLVALYILKPHMDTKHTISFPPNAHIKKIFLNYPLCAFENIEKTSRHKIGIYFIQQCMRMDVYGIVFKG